MGHRGVLVPQHPEDDLRDLLGSPWGFSREDTLGPLGGSLSPENLQEAVVGTMSTLKNINKINLFSAHCSVKPSALRLKVIKHVMVKRLLYKR